jgi:YfiH family protein
MHTWHWHTWQAHTYLTCTLLKDWQHGFFTQQFSPRSPFELVEILHPAAEVYRVKQVHGNTVLSSSEVAQSVTHLSADLDAYPMKESDRLAFPDADGLFTEAGHQAVWVCTADCTPVLIADEETGQVAAIHAGWRGTALGIVQKTVARMLAQGSQIRHLRVAMGPAIAGEVYQVSTTVAAQVGASIVRQPAGMAPAAASDLEQLRAIDAPEEILDALRQIPDSPLFPDPAPGKARLDVRRVNALQLEQIGIAPEQIAIAPYCTYQTPDLFFSYRRQPQKKVQWSGIVSKS